MAAITDDFNRADAADPGASYTVRIGSFPIVSNQVNAATVNDNHCERVETFNADNECYAKVYDRSGAYPSVTARGSGASWAAANFYAYSLDPFSANGTIQKATIGAFSDLKTTGVTFASGDEIGIRVVTVGSDAVITVYKNKIQVDTYTDSSSPHLSGGKIGIGSYNGGTSTVFDDLNGGDVGGAGLAAAVVAAYYNQLRAE